MAWKEDSIIRFQNLASKERIGVLLNNKISKNDSTINKMKHSFESKLSSTGKKDPSLDRIVKVYKNAFHVMLAYHVRDSKL